MARAGPNASRIRIVKKGAKAGLVLFANNGSSDPAGGGVGCGEGASAFTDARGGSGWVASEGSVWGIVVDGVALLPHCGQMTVG